MEYARLFVALEIPTTLRSVLARSAAEAAELSLDGSKDRVRAITADNIHLTLAFLGNRLRDDAPMSRELFMAACQGISGFEVQCAGLLFLPRESRARICSVRLEGGELRAFGERTRQSFRKAVGSDGAPLLTDDRPFLPHVTVARSKDGFSPSTIQIFTKRMVVDTEPFRVSRGALFESKLSSAGPSYELIWQFEL